MNTHRRRLATSFGLTAVLIVIGTIITIDRVPVGGALHAQTSWRGLVVAPERRYTPYDADDYRYPQSVEDRIIGELGGVYGPYTGHWFASKTETDIEHMVARSEAHDSGLCAADSVTRRRFATDPSQCLRVRLFFVDGPRGFMRAARQELLDLSKACGEGGGGGLLTGRYPISVSLGVVPLVLPRRGSPSTIRSRGWLRSTRSFRTASAPTKLATRRIRTRAWMKQGYCVAPACTSVHQ